MRTSYAQLRHLYINHCMYAMIVMPRRSNLAKLQQAIYCSRNIALTESETIRISCRLVLNRWITFHVQCKRYSLSACLNIASSRLILALFESTNGRWSDKLMWQTWWPALQYHLNLITENVNALPVERNYRITRYEDTYHRHQSV